MRKTSKLGILLASSAVFALTSCGAKNVSFKDAIDYVSKNYDKNSYANVKGKYTVAIEKLGVNLAYDVRNEVGYVTSGTEKLGINGVKLTLNDLPGVCVNSSYMNYVNSAYCQFGAITAEFVTKMALDMNYTINNGGLNISLTDNGGEDGLFDILKCAFPALNVYYIVTQLTGGKFKYDITPAQAQAALQFTNSVNALYQANAPFNVALSATSSLIGGTMPGPMEIISYIGKYGVGMNPNSKASGSFAVNASTDKEGFLNKMSLELKATDLDLNLATGSYERVIDPEVIIPFYTINLTGEVGFKVSITADFN